MILYDSGKILLAEAGGDKGLKTKRREGTFWGDGNILYFVCGGGCMTIYICQKSLNYTPKKINFTPCK